MVNSYFLSIVYIHTSYNYSEEREKKDYSDYFLNKSLGIVSRTTSCMSFFVWNWKRRSFFITRD